MTRQGTFSLRHRHRHRLCHRDRHCRDRSRRQSLRTWRLPVVLLAVAAVFGSAVAAAQSDDVRLLTLDEAVWVAFYDLPSRRFRSIRDHFVQGELDEAARDLEASRSFLAVEAERALPELKPAFESVIARLAELRNNLDTPRVTAADLDAAFARTHWLLTQQYFVLSLRSRDAERHRNAGHYLWATAHHLERSVLWSNAAIDRRTVTALESLREMAARLRDDPNPQRVYRDRPLRLAARTIVRVGEHLDRNVRIRELVDSEI